MIKIIAIGKIKDKNLTALVEDYKKKISRYHKIEILEVKDEPIKDDELEVLNIEGERALKLIDSGSIISVSLTPILSPRLDFCKIADWEYFLNPH